MNYIFKPTQESATLDKAVMELYLNGKITKRKAKRMIAENNYNETISDEDFNELFNLGWYQEAVDKYRFEWLKKEKLHRV